MIGLIIIIVIVLALSGAMKRSEGQAHDYLRSTEGTTYHHAVGAGVGCYSVIGWTVILVLFFLMIAVGAGGGMRP